MQVVSAREDGVGASALCCIDDRARHAIAAAGRKFEPASAALSDKGFKARRQAREAVAEEVAQLARRAAETETGGSLCVVEKQP